MRFDDIHPFIDSAATVLERVLGSEIHRGRLTLTASPAVFRGVVALVGLAGEVEGRVIFDMDVDTALGIVSAMNGESLREFTPMAQDCLQELAGMMIGKAVTALTEKGFRFHLTPPTLFLVERMTVVPPPFETLVTALGTKMGEVVMNVALRTT